MRLPRLDRRLSGWLRTLPAFLFAGMLLLPAGASAAQACLQPGSGVGGTGAPQGGIGGTGIPSAGGTGGTGDRANSGVGGTGAVEGGIGGTGEQADSGVGGTGIVGTITGFASVCIGDLEVHYDAATPVSINGQPSSLNRLAIGQVVAMEAGPGAKGLTARSIAILHALEGPVTRADVARGVLEVMGQPVRLAAGVDASRIAAGSAVRVSGLRDARGIVHATRVEAAAELAEASAIGFLRRAGAVANLDGLEVVGVSGRTGAELLVRGKWDGQRLRVRERRTDPSLPFAGRVREVVIEGLVHGRSDQALTISGFEVRLGPAVRLSGDRTAGLAEGSRIRVAGHIEAGRLIVADLIKIERGRSGAGDRTGASGPASGGDDSAAAARTSSGGNRDGEDPRGAGGSDRGRDVGDRGSGDRKEASGNRDGGSADRGSRSEKGEKSDRIDRSEKLERAEKTERTEKGAKVERAVERVERAVKPESDRGGRSGRSGRD